MTAQLIALPDFDLLQVSGPDTDKFLQGQLSCNLDQVSENQSLPGLYCNLKGRIIADFLVVRLDDGVLLRTAADMATLLQERLHKFSVFFKAQMSVAREQWQRYGLSGSGAERMVADLCPEMPEKAHASGRLGSVVITRLPGREPRFELLLPVGSSLPVALQELVISDDTKAWSLADIRAGHFAITPATSEQFTPQVLNRDIDGSIDFRKGCFTGQEVVARMYYRSQAKKRLYQLRSRDPLPHVPHKLLASHTAIVRGNGEDAAGEILAHQMSPDHKIELLAILRCQDADKLDSAPLVFVSTGADGIDCRSELSLQAPLPDTSNDNQI